jgi:glycosyltransferase involved in cell wall biosynthesis
VPGRNVSLDIRVALVHDALVNRGGAERIAATLCRAFPGAPLYTTVYLPNRTYASFRHVAVRPTILQRFVTSERALKATFPLALLAMDRLRLRDVDVVLSSSTFAAKFARAVAPAVHVCYCYTPFRLAWDPASYMSPGRGSIARLGLRVASRLARTADRHAAARIDRFLTMTETTRERIQAAYGRHAEVIPPPVDCGSFTPDPGRRTDTFLVVSRLEPYKRVDIVIEAFNKLGLPLLVIGDGTQAARLRAAAARNVTFRAGVSDGELREIYARARAVLFPQSEDYGLVPLEALASGTPVVAYGNGGVLETMIPAREPTQAAHATAVFFHEQTPAAVTEAIRSFNSYAFDSAFLRAHAERFDTPAFIARVRRAVADAVGGKSATPA